MNWKKFHAKKELSQCLEKLVLNTYFHFLERLLKTIHVYMGKSIQEWTKSNLWKEAFKKLEVIGSACLGRPYHFKLFKGCLPQILLGPFSNTLTHVVALLIEEVIWTVRLLLLPSITLCPYSSSYWWYNKFDKFAKFYYTLKHFVQMSLEAISSKNGYERCFFFTNIY